MATTDRGLALSLQLEVEFSERKNERKGKQKSFHFLSFIFWNRDFSMGCVWEK